MLPFLSLSFPIPSFLFTRHWVAPGSLTSSLLPHLSRSLVCLLLLLCEDLLGRISLHFKNGSDVKSVMFVIHCSLLPVLHYLIPSKTYSIQSYRCTDANWHSPLLPFPIVKTVTNELKWATHFYPLVKFNMSVLILRTAILNQQADSFPSNQKNQSVITER